MYETQTEQQCIKMMVQKLIPRFIYVQNTKCKKKHKMSKKDPYFVCFFSFVFLLFFVVVLNMYMCMKLIEVTYMHFLFKTNTIIKYFLFTVILLVFFFFCLSYVTCSRHITYIYKCTKVRLTIKKEKPSTFSLKKKNKFRICYIIYIVALLL